MPKTKTCFFIDDDEDDRDFLCTAIHSINPDILCKFATDGVIALQHLSDNPDFVPAYIFIDMNMPFMDGRQCLKELTKIVRLQNSQIFIYSTSAPIELVEELKALGAKDFLKKPSSMSDLEKMMCEVLNVA